MPLPPKISQVRWANGIINVIGGPAAETAEHPKTASLKPKDIAAAIVFLCARSGSHVNGAVFPVDGEAMLIKGILKVSSNVHHVRTLPGAENIPRPGSTWTLQGNPFQS